MAQQSGLGDSSHLAGGPSTCKLAVGVQPENDTLQALVADWTCLEEITLFSLSLHSFIHTCNVSPCNAAPSSALHAGYIQYTGPLVCKFCSVSR